MAGSFKSPMMQHIVSTRVWSHVESTEHCRPFWTRSGKGNFTPTKHWTLKKVLKTPFSMQPALSHTVSHMHQLSTYRLIMPRLCLTTGWQHHATQHSLENPTYLILVKQLHGHFETFMQTSLTSDKIFQSTLKIWIASQDKNKSDPLEQF